MQYLCDSSESRGPQPPPPAEARNSLLTRLRSAAGCDPLRLIIGIGRYEHVAFVQLILNLV